MSWIKSFFTRAKVRVYVKFIGLVIESIIVAWIISFFFKHLFWQKGVESKDQEYIVKRLHDVWTIYGFAATRAIFDTIALHQKISVLEDEKELEKLKKQGLPNWFHFFMFLLSLYLVKVTAQVSYDTAESAGRAIYETSFFIFIIFRIVSSFEDPTSEIWWQRKTKNPPKEDK